MQENGVGGYGPTSGDLDSIGSTLAPHLWKGILVLTCILDTKTLPISPQRQRPVYIVVSAI